MLSRRILRIKILQSLYSHFMSKRTEYETEKEVLYSIERAYDLYVYIFQMLVDVKTYYENQLDMAKNKILPTAEDLNPNTRFIENIIINEFSNNSEYLKYQSRKPLNWVRHPEQVKALYNKLLVDETFQEYMLTPIDFKKDKSILKYILTNIIPEEELFYADLEEDSIFWATETDFIISQLIKDIDNIKKDTISSQPLFKTEEVDEERDFAKSLLRQTLSSFSENANYIKEQTINWDVERIAFIDTLILHMALTELKEFQNIPQKVTFNEYIDIAKAFSTQNSGQFINGVLDKAAARLKSENKINKTGRGLV